MERSIKQWLACDAQKMAQTLSRAALFYALQDAKNDLIALHRLAMRVASLNPEAGEIGAGMLADLVEHARRVVKEPS